MKKKLIPFLCIVLSLALLVVFAKTYADDWPQFHHDTFLSGVSMSDAPITNALAWTYPTGSPVESSPAVVDGILYVGNWAGEFYALDASSGVLIWGQNLGGQIQSSPAVEGGSAYILSTTGTMYSLDAFTGAINWSRQISTSPAWDWASPAVSGDFVYIASSNGIMYCLNKSDGSIVWTTNIVSLGGTPTPNSMIAVANGKVYTGTHNFNSLSPTLVAMDAVTGVIEWSYNYSDYHGPVVGMINCNGVSVADGDGDGDLEVYFGVYNWNGVGPQAIALDEDTGVEEWAVSIGGNSTSTPAVHNGVVFIGSDDYQLYALDATANGAIIWTSSTGGEIYASPAVADGMVFVGSWDHTFYAFDEATGALVWSYFTGASRLRSSPAVADGMVFVGNENGNIYAFSALRINKELVDAWDENTEGDNILDLHEKWYFEMDITITNNTDSLLEDIVVMDNFGGDLEVESVGGVNIGSVTPTTLSGKQKQATYSTPVGNVTILWTGKTEKAHLTWDIEDLEPDESITLTVVVSTDLNPGQGKKDPTGKNEYTSEGTHTLNSGPTAMVMMGDEEVIISDSREITVTVGQPPQLPKELQISEIRIDQPSTDYDEYFELSGPNGSSLEDLTYIVIGDGSGLSGEVESVIDLNGESLSLNGFFVASEDTFTLGTSDLTTNLNFENSDNVTHLLVLNFSGSIGDDLDTNDDGVLDVTPWTSIIDCVALIETVGSGDLTYCSEVIGPDGSFVPGHVFKCDDGWHIGSFVIPGSDTPGSENSCVP